jgi:hypothetical protein
LNLSFSEAANGCIKQVSYRAKNVCDSCGEYTFMLEVIAQEHFFYCTWLLYVYLLNQNLNLCFHAVTVSRHLCRSHFLK